MYEDERHIVIKLASGYNIGVRITPEIHVEKVREGVKPSFTLPPRPEQKPGSPKVALVSTGGTIASRVDYRTGAVRAALSAEELYSIVPELAEVANIDAEALFSVYSENLTPKHWTAMAERAAYHIKGGAAGVVVAHGTDTMGYTAAALSFALQNLPVPVILVGAQRSSDRPSSDAALNLLEAVRAAAFGPFAEVVVAMHASASDDSIVFHRGTKVRKCHTSRRDTFRSINSPPLAKMEHGKIAMLIEDYRKRDPSGELMLKPNFEEKVALVKFHPGASPKLVKWLVEDGYKGIVLEGTGLGHVGDYWFSAVKEAVENGVLVAMTSQCIWGRVNMKVYDQGRDLLAMGVIPLDDMLPETALVKTMWALGQTKDQKEVRNLLKANIAYEYSPRTLYE